MYLRMLKSESTKKYLAMQNSFFDKAGSKVKNRKAIRQEDDIDSWVLNNVEKTSFKNCEEAETEIQKIADANLLVFMENQELYTYMGECMEICDGISSELIKELMGEYGADFRF